MQRITRMMQRQVWRIIRAKKTMDPMFTASKAAVSLLLTLSLLGASPQKETNTPSSGGPEYTADAQLRLPEHYREWVWLTSDFHTASDPAKMQAGEHRLFNNIFASPEASKAFLQTGTWPDKTMLVVEQRAAEDMVSSNPNQKGTGQSSVIGIGVEVKDETRFPGRWAFFGFQGGKSTASMIPVTADCYSCHAAHGAADATFVQFYPTLLPTAKSRGTLSPAYLRETESALPATK